MSDLTREPRPILYEDPGRIVAHDRAVMTAVFLFALALRLLLIRQLAATPLWEMRPVDLGYYHDWALRLLEGGGPREVFEQSPLYAWILAGIYRVFGSGPLAPRLIQSVVGAVTCVLIARIGWRLIGPAAGLAAGLLAAAYAPFLFYDTMLMKPVFSVFFFTLTIRFLVESEGWKRGVLVLAGLALGLGALVRDNLILLAPAIAVWLAADAWIGTARIHRRRLMDVAGSVGAFAAGVLMVVAPVTIRNYDVSGEFVPLTAGGGEVFYIGNNPEADGYYSPPAFVRASAVVEHEDFRVEAARRLGQPREEITRRESSDFWLNEGLTWIASHPADWLALLSRKAAIFWNHYELPDNLHFSHHRRLCPLLGAPLPVFGVMAPLAAAGLLLTASRWRALLCLSVIGAAYFATILIFFNFGRFRLPMAAVILILAGGALGGMVDALRAGRVRMVAAAAGLFVAVFLACNVDLENDPLHIGQSRAQLAALLLEAGRLDEADEESLAGVRGLEDAWVRWGGRLDGSGHGIDLSDAGASAPRAGVSFYETISEAYATRAAVLNARGFGGEAGAWRRWARAAAVDPSAPPPGTPAAHRYRDGAIAAEAGRFEEAVAAYRAALDATGRDRPRARLGIALRLAEALHRAGRPREALAVVEEALDAMPDIPDIDHAAAHYGRALIYRDLGEPERMRFHMRECLRLNPAHPRAGWMRETLAAWEADPS